MNGEELLEVYDSSGRAIGLFPRRECHQNKKLAHKAVHILVFNTEGKIILQRRSSKKDLFPLMWDTSVGGHLSPNESYIDAAVRECEEELGFIPTRLIYLYKYKMEAENETELVETYLTLYDGPFLPCDNEVCDVKAFSVEDLFSDDARKLFSPFFLREIEEFKKFLQKRGAFYEGNDNWWRRYAWERFISCLEKRKD